MKIKKKNTNIIFITIISILTLTVAHLYIKNKDISNEFQKIIIRNGHLNNIIEANYSKYINEVGINDTK